VAVAVALKVEHQAVLVELAVAVLAQKIQHLQLLAQQILVVAVAVLVQ
jgi:hypothetical protein